MTFRRGVAGVVVWASMLVALLLFSAAQAAAPAGWQSFEMIGLRFAAPPSVDLLEQADDVLVLGEPDWERYGRDLSFDRPTGLLIDVRLQTMANLRFLEESEAATRLGQPVMIGRKTFDVYAAADVMETAEGPLEVHGRIIVARTPVAGGDFVTVSITVADLSRDEAHERIDAIVATFEAVDPERFSDEVPLTRGLDGALEVLVPAGMYQNWDRSYFFRMQSDHDLGLSNFQVKLGDTTPPGSRSAELELRLALENLSSAATIERTVVLGESVWRIENGEHDDSRVVTVVFETCFPADTVVVLQYRETGEWREQRGSLEAVFETLELAFPEGSVACSDRHLEPVRAAQTSSAPAAAPAGAPDEAGAGAVAKQPGEPVPERPAEPMAERPAEPMAERPAEPPPAASTDAAAPADAAAPGDAPAEAAAPSDAAAPTVPVALSGNLSAQGAEVMHDVVLTDDGALRLSVQAEEGLSVHLRLIDVNGSSVMQSDTAGVSAQRVIEADGLAPGTYTARVSRHQGEGRYDLTVDVTAVATPNDVEPNDSLEQAQPIGLAAPSTGRLGYGNASGRDSEDFFALTLPDDGDLSVSVAADDGLTIHLRLIDVNGSSVIVSDTSGSQSARTVEAFGLAPGTYYARVIRHGGQGGYTLTPAFVAVTLQADPEPNDSPVQALAFAPLAPDAPATGRLGYGNAVGRDTEDYLPIVLDDDGDLRVLVEADPNLTIHLRLIDADGSSVIASDTSGSATSRSVEGTGLGAGTYFLRVTRHGGQGGYTVTPSYSVVGTPSDQEPNDVAVQAVPIPIGSVSSGRLGYGNAFGRDGEDWFTLVLEEGANVRITVRADDALKLHLRLYDVNGSSVLHSDTSGVASQRSVERAELSAGTYYLRVSRHQGQGGYRIDPQRW